MNIYDGNETIATMYGKVKGEKCKHSGTIHWLGVPYAKAPVNELRWKAPCDHEPWDGVRMATEYGNCCVQVVGDTVVGAEDCLYLNIWRPDYGSSSLPVFVYAHGGGNLSGSGQDFFGEELAAETNSMIISINYRLGAMGFFRHPSLRTRDPIDDSGNYGLLDILCALRWVKGNIGRFGGDPRNVTLAGQSAGARNVLAAMISPLGRGLFHKAAILSGGMTTADPLQGDAKSEEVLQRLLLATGKAATEADAKAWSATRSTEEVASFLLSVNSEYFASVYGQVAIQMEPFPHLFRDGAVIPVEGFAKIDHGHYLKVPILLGSTATEFSGFAASDPQFLHSLMDGSIFSDAEKSKLYAKTVQYGSELYAGFNVEEVAERIAVQQDQPPIYAYRFEWGTREEVMESPFRFLLGAMHGADILFYTGDEKMTLQNYPNGYLTKENEPGRRELTALLRGYLKQFLYTGNPKTAGLPIWKAWRVADNEQRILKMDADRNHAITWMDSEYLKAEEVRSRMEDDPALSPEQRAWIREHLLAGRFFWKEAL
jgi:para-nitrobenzyl esterase